MKTYQYTSPENTIIAVFDEDGISRMSMLASAVPDSVEILPYVEPPEPIPTTVTMRQARLALLGAGLYSNVDAVIDSLPSPQKEAARIEWGYATDVHRSSGLVPMMGAALALTEAQLDSLFLTASTL